MDAVQKRGFIVDKKNIKINREKNEVILVALKASGEKKVVIPTVVIPMS